MVFKARHSRLKRIAALKVLSPHRANDPDAVDRFHREMEALGRLSHPHIARATDAGESGGYYYLAMEYVEGMDIARVLGSLGQMSLADACEIARQTADALDFIHQHGMIHRDIKPSNLLLGRDGIVRVLDLGLVRLGGPGDGGEQLTITGTVMGTADFIAPEQARGSRDVDIRADVYSLGCTLYSLLTGSPPFTGPGFETAYEKFRAHNEATPPPVREKRPDVPEALEALIARMLEKDPSARPLAPAKVALELASFCQGQDLGRLAAIPAADPTEVPTPLPNLLPSPDQPAAVQPTVTQNGHTTARLASPARPAPLPRLSRRYRRWVVAAILAGIVAGLALVVILGAGGRPGAGADGQDPVAPDEGRPPEPLPGPPLEVAPPPRPLRGTRIFPPGQWVELLDRQVDFLEWQNPPEKSEWQNPPEKSSWRAAPEKHELWLSNAGWGVVEVEKIDAKEFDLEVTMYQHPWTGGMGLFFCGRAEKIPGQATIWGSYLRVDMLSPVPRGPIPEPVDSRTLELGDFRRFDQTGQLYIRHLKGGGGIPRFPQGDQRLGVTLGPGGLTGVTWNDKPVAKDVLGDLGCPAAGPVGLFVENSSATFRSLRVRVR
ncbi:MAG: pknH 2 [Gemmataceae bacterium]|nr:pknH 2 [Gemmataceae bacterium]